LSGLAHFPFQYQGADTGAGYDLPLPGQGLDDSYSEAQILPQGSQTLYIPFASAPQSEIFSHPEFR